MNIEYRFIAPLDVLFLRGNQLFGDPGSYGESLIPPRPSVAAGALRSRMLSDDKTDLVAFSGNRITHPTLGTPQQPGSFTLAGFYLAWKTNGRVEILIAPPADLVIHMQNGEKKGSQLRELPLVNRLMPTTIDLPSSFELPLLPVLAETQRGKSGTGWWLTQAGWEAYLMGNIPSSEQLIHSTRLWTFDARVGIGMNGAKRSVEKGMLFSMQAAVLKKDVGFVAAVTGAMPPQNGLLRFGGDGRAASIDIAKMNMTEPDYETICQAGCCRIVLTSPGLFKHGWKMPGIGADNSFSLSGISAKLVSACVPRYETISGWDLANRKPKLAQRIVPTGSVYWLNELDATPDALRKLADNGLWGDPCEDDSRRAEGFNRIAFAVW
jgi:CRISPR-associated protein Cmr3